MRPSSRDVQAGCVTLCPPLYTFWRICLSWGRIEPTFFEINLQCIFVVYARASCFFLPSFSCSYSIAFAIRMLRILYRQRMWNDSIWRTRFIYIVYVSHLCTKADCTANLYGFSWLFQRRLVSRPKATLVFDMRPVIYLSRNQSQDILLPEEVLYKGQRRAVALYRQVVVLFLWFRQEQVFLYWLYDQTSFRRNSRLLSGCLLGCAHRERNLFCV